MSEDKLTGFKGDNCCGVCGTRLKMIEEDGTYLGMGCSRCEPEMFIHNTSNTGICFDKYCSVCKSPKCSIINRKTLEVERTFCKNCESLSGISNKVSPVFNDVMCDKCGRCILIYTNNGKLTGLECRKCNWELSTNNGIKHDADKLRWSLLPINATEQVVRVLEHGAEKYGAHNWKKLENLQDRYINASLRHIVERLKGNKIDPDSGVDHLAHAVCSLLFILEYENLQ